MVPAWTTDYSIRIDFVYTDLVLCTHTRSFNCVMKSTVTKEIACDLHVLVAIQRYTLVSDEAGLTCHL